ncbi:DEAD/DEAH box helicase [Chloroflexus sp.]|uniref:DEAD/DEAH box helicase n=1 Tax=Chloroflexus sp. TaxID=1904827 RepID=UPI002ADE04CC|nr:DEAD/DEAH box helicase [Chloroflexus sp.]
MTIFDLHSAVLNDYRAFVRSFLHIADDGIRAFVDQALEEESHLWPDFLLQVSPSYERGPNVDELVQQGRLHPETARIFRTSAGAPFTLYRHQIAALEKARAGHSYIVTSGTGSSKSMTYFIPIVDVLLRQGLPRDRTAALLVYPMNALVNSQMLALETLRDEYQRRYGRPFPVTFARYTGETRDDARQALRQHPPHILLNNYMMLELMLVRPEDRRFLDRASGIVFLVFDELHTYRGRQGADVAMLIRRLKEAAADNLLHIGTSATMIAERSVTPAQRRQVVADFAMRLFSHPFTASDIIKETLTPFTEGDPPPDELGAALRTLPAPPPDLETYRQHPLSRWIEHTFGLEPEAEGAYRRRVPITLSAAAAKLAAETNLPVAACQQLLQRWLALGGHWCARIRAVPSPSNCTSSSARDGRSSPPWSRRSGVP